MAQRKDPDTDPVSLREFLLMTEELSLIGCFEVPDPWLVGDDMLPWSPGEPDPTG